MKQIIKNMWKAGVIIPVLFISSLYSQSLLWRYQYTDNNVFYGSATGFKVDSAGNSYLTGWGYWDDYLRDYITISISPTGTKRWEHRIYGFHVDHEWGTGVGVTMNSSGSGKTVFAGYQHVDIPPVYKRYGIDATTGSQLWEQADATWSNNTFGDFNDYIYGPGISYDNTGNLRWQVNVNGSAVVVLPDGTSFAGGEGEAVCIDINGNEVWRYTNSSVSAGIWAAYGDGNVYFTGYGDGHLWSLTADGNERWYVPLNANNYTVRQISYADNRVYIAGILSGTNTGFVRCYSAADGTLLWEYTGDCGQEGVAGLPNGYCAAAGYTGTIGNETYTTFRIFNSTGGIVYSYTDSETSLPTQGIYYIGSQKIVLVGGEKVGGYMGAYAFDVSPFVSVKEKNAVRNDSDNKLCLNIYTLRNVHKIEDLPIFNIYGEKVKHRNLASGIYFLKDSGKKLKIIFIK